jgi:hypothetical protein
VVGERERFFGAWSLLDVRDLGPGGRPAAPTRFGVAPRGVIVYGADGTVSVNFMRPGRPLWLDEEHPPETALAAAARGYGGYAGRWEIDEGRALVLHHVDVALIPDRVGATLVRSYSFAGSLLTLSPPPFGVGAGATRRILVWERLRRPA